VTSNYDEWIGFLKPETLKANLINYALYIALFEAFRDYIISSVKDFYVNGFDETGLTYRSEYSEKVLSISKSKLYASLHWLKEADAIDDDDILEFEKQKNFRNKMAHEMMSSLFENEGEGYVENLIGLMKLRIKIEKWWILNVDIPTNSDFDNKDVTEDQIVTGSALMNKIMIDILTGKDGEADFYYKEFLKMGINRSL
jgi:hypothetical protein